MKTTLKLIALIFIALINLNCTNGKNSKKQSEKIKIVAPVEFKEQSVNQTIIDIRTPNEFNQGHIEGAININYFDKTFLDEVSKLDKNKPIFIYCRSGNRSASASKKIVDLGYNQVYDLEGGIGNWKKSNLKIVK